MSTTSGCSGARLLDRLVAVGGDADELDVVERGDQPPEAVADDAVVVGEQDADHARGHLQLDGRSLARARSDRQRPAGLRDEVLEQRQAEVALGAARARARPASKPAAVVGRRRAASPPPRGRATVARAPTSRSRVRLHVAQRLARHAVDQRVVRRRRRRGVVDVAASVATPAAASGLSRSLSAASQPGATRGSADGSRRAGCAGRGRPGAAAPVASRSAARLGVVAAPLGRRRRAARGRRRRRRGPAPRRRAGRRRCAGAPASDASTAFSSSASRSRWPRCSRRASDHASGTWNSSRTSRPPSERRRERAAAAARRSALTESKRW